MVFVAQLDALFSAIVEDIDDYFFSRRVYTRSSVQHQLVGFPTDLDFSVELNTTLILRSIDGPMSLVKLIQVRYRFELSIRRLLKPTSGRGRGR